MYKNISLMWNPSFDFISSVFYLQISCNVCTEREKHVYVCVCVCVFFFMVLSAELNAGRNHNMRIDNRSFERVEDFKYLGRTLTNQNFIQKEIKSRLKSGNVRYHSVQNILPSSLLSKNIKIKIYRNIILPFGHLH